MFGLWTRRRFARGLGAGALGLSVCSAAAAQQARVGEWFPKQDPEEVKEVVGASHRDLVRVQELVERRPALANSTIDWAFGDWESALGAASHTGRREIAEFLIANGARVTIFSAAMLGQLDVVKAFIAAEPGVQRIAGPHSIPLLNHALAGGADAAHVAEYLRGLGDAGLRPESRPLDAIDRDAVVGTYAYGPTEAERFEVYPRNNEIGITKPGMDKRFLFHLGDLVFFPSGAPKVKIAFARENGKATQLTIADPDVLVIARRI